MTDEARHTRAWALLIKNLLNADALASLHHLSQCHGHETHFEGQNKMLPLSHLDDASVGTIERIVKVIESAQRAVYDRNPLTSDIKRIHMDFDSSMGETRAQSDKDGNIEFDRSCVSHHISKWRSDSTSGAVCHRLPNDRSRLERKKISLTRLGAGAARYTSGSTAELPLGRHCLMCSNLPNTPSISQLVISAVIQDAKPAARTSPFRKPITPSITDLNETFPTTREISPPCL